MRHGPDPAGPPLVADRPAAKRPRRPRAGPKPPDVAAPLAPPLALAAPQAGAPPLLPDTAPLAEALLILPATKPAKPKRTAAKKTARKTKARRAKTAAPAKPRTAKPRASQAAAPAKATASAITLPSLAEALIAPQPAPQRVATPSPWRDPPTATPAASVVASLPAHPALATRRQVWLPGGTAPEAHPPLPRDRAPARPPQGLVAAIGAWLKSAASLFSLGLLRRPATRPRRGPAVPHDLPVVAKPEPAAAPAPPSEIDVLRAENAELRARLDALLARTDARGRVK